MNTKTKIKTLKGKNALTNKENTPLYNFFKNTEIEDIYDDKCFFGDDEDVFVEFDVQTFFNYDYGDEPFTYGLDSSEDMSYPREIDKIDIQILDTNIEMIEKEMISILKDKVREYHSENDPYGRVY